MGSRRSQTGNIFNLSPKKRPRNDDGYGLSPKRAHFAHSSQQLSPKYSPQMSEYALQPVEPTKDTCFGALFPARAQLLCQEVRRIQLLPWEGFICFDLIFKDGPEPEYRVTHKPPEKYPRRDVGVLDTITTGHLESLRDLATSLSFKAVISSDDLEALKMSKTKKIIVDTSVNILGARELADEIGRTLKQADLQHPFYLAAGIRYINPQWFYAKDDPLDLRHLVGPSTVETDAKRISKLVASALGSLGRPSHLESRGALLKADVVFENLLTQLKHHQVEGVEFILSREDPFCLQNIFSDMKAHIGKEIFSDVHFLRAGGILADFMGLGKTLTMLSSVVASRDTAAAFQSRLNPPGGCQNVKATLIVGTSRQVIDVWAHEIEKHFKPRCLSTILFHGDSRVRSATTFLEHDVVLTTYGTLTADWKRSKILQGVTWFRVVLDEAHWIRNPSAQQFKAAADIKAERRWCLSGTPIQNSMHDLLSILKFLQFEPFTKAKHFDKHVVKPLLSEPEGGLKALRVLLGAIYLRRNSSHLGLMPKENERVFVTLNEEEQAEQGRILKLCQDQYDTTAGQKPSLRKYSVLFGTIVKIRQLCSNGVARGDGSAQGCSVCAENDEDAELLLMTESVCPECSRPLEKTSSGPLLVPASPDSALSPQPVSPLPARLSPFASFSSSQGDNTPDFSNSSKLDAVMENLEQHRFGAKSIVFTSWRRTLDCLAARLSNKNMGHVQIDGRVNGVERHKRLGQFQEAPDVRVLLMSLEVGAVGLTLTAATRVHIVEPPWNPAIEDQAVARADRMGQTETVTVVRYITRNSIEQKIMERQDRKRGLAELSLDSHKAAEEVNARLQDLKFVLDFGAQM
ncbi:SNF2 family N-terminal domain-containing protein [Immersiella caudata]|uniref:SNF2 family N-terminal domain-containing protein n=1 Tax=Immersiella caudata TaxID=314043 RepID=A0AA39X5Q2_9PEZI|nr:SNF2 family N-terminal domain-containing protein [Immersiella caudata]